MKQFFIKFLLAVCFTTLSCADRSTKLASSPDPVAGKASSATANDGQFDGTIDKIDIEKRLIKVQHWPLSKTFQVPPECEIDILTNSNATLSELKVDDGVTVAYSGTGDNLVANRIVRKGKEQDRERNEKLERLDKMLNPSPNQ